MRRASLALGLLCLLLALPVISLASAWLALDAAALEVLRHQFTTVLADYTRGSLMLAVAVGVGVAMVGTGAAVAVTLFDFPGRRLFELTLLLPLAMPAYVLAYVYTDTLQSSGALQIWLRGLTGARGALWPDVRSLWGAVVLFVLALYPYVYLLTRTALAGRGSTLLEAARLLGAGLVRRIVTIALPLARPAIAAGVSLALMETLADYGVGAYFGLQTYTTGIYRAWLSFGDRLAAAQLATVLLVVVGLLAWAEQKAQARLRYATTRPAGRGADAQPLRLRGLPAAIAVLVCALPVLAGFVIPVLLLLRLVVREALYGEFGLPWDRFLGWSWSTLQLAGTAAVLAALLALALALALRWRPAPLLQAGVRVVSLGYAVPGAVIAIGLLLPAGWLQQRFPGSTWGTILTSTTLGLVYAYLVRFSAVALQSVQAGMARLPTSLDESGRMLGAGPWRLFVQVHGPLLLPSVLGAALLVFVDVMKELPATLVLRPFDSDTLAVVAYQLARDERLAEAALPSLAIVAVGLIPVLMLARAIRRADR
ncbi:ABC transporter permease [Sphaerotilus mobilis]|uniref:Iron(III) transport system permease protein n=1 Tax=Sphaerotilus mobilis TaxID=47994 RepID=A0A4Q7LT81_9BURK|nr:iron ABC transporter permease [Sphaerotilus mobilis]RZS57864.1 iron(III) transport system permease protein [Sphaerotilus mobilis]